MPPAVIAPLPPVSHGYPSVPWHRLTQQKTKLELYSQEASTVEAWMQVQAQFGEQAPTQLGRIATITLKPEAMVGRRLTSVLDYLQAQGFMPLVCRRLQLTRTLAHTLWRFQWNKATVDRTRLHIYVAQRCDWLWIALEDRNPPSRLPASVRLWGLKGAVDARLRTPDQLRTVLRMKNRMLGFVHTADEPADIVRELGLFFGYEQRASLLRLIASRIGRDCFTEVAGAGQQLEDRTIEHSVDAAEVIERLKRRGPTAALAALLEGWGKRHYALDEVRAAFGPPVDETARWDFIVLGTEFIEYDYPEVKAVLDAQAIHNVVKRWQETD